MNTKLVIFDFDGTILNSSNIWETIFFNALNKKLDLSSIFRVDMTSKEIFNEIYKQTEKEKEFLEFCDYVNKIAIGTYITKRPKNYLKKYINLLRDLKIKVVIGTKNNEQIVKGYLDYYNIKVDNIYTEDTHNALKSDGTLFDVIRENEKIDFEDMLFIDDNYSNLKGAKNKNIKVFGIRDKFYKEFNNQKEILNIADRFIIDYKELYQNKIF